MTFLILHQAVEPWSRYLIADTNNRVRDQDEFKDYSGKEMEYKTDHIRLFDEAKLVWPAPRFPSKGIYCRHLDQRAFEVVHYANSVWPYSCPPDGSFVPEFLDCNFSLSPLAVDGPRSASPWRRDMMSTITGFGQYIMRWAELTEDCQGPERGTVESACAPVRHEVLLRQLEGRELMALMGYATEYITPLNMPCHKLASSFAGNAFSAFAILPAIIGIMATVEPDAKLAPSSPSNVEA